MNSRPKDKENDEDVEVDEYEQRDNNGMLLVDAVDEDDVDDDSMFVSAALMFVLGEPKRMMVLLFALDRIYR